MAGRGLHALRQRREIRRPVFADLNTTDISEDIRSNVFRRLVG